MTIRLVSDEKIAETSQGQSGKNGGMMPANCWYKLGQFGYEALAETVISVLLEQSGLESYTPFTFVRYRLERIHVHGRERTGCVSENFLRPGQSLITLNRLLTGFLGMPLKQKLARLPSDKQRIAFLGEATAEYTGAERISAVFDAAF